MLVSSDLGDIGMSVLDAEDWKDLEQYELELMAHLYTKYECAVVKALQSIQMSGSE
jgi:hypothetical protein